MHIAQSQIPESSHSLLGLHWVSRFKWDKALFLNLYSPESTPSAMSIICPYKQTNHTQSLNKPSQVIL